MANTQKHEPGIKICLNLVGKADCLLGENLVHDKDVKFGSSKVRNKIMNREQIIRTKSHFIDYKIMI